MMLFRYEPNVRATIIFLKWLGVKVNNATVNETLQNHPDWPSLLCITDSLKVWNIPNAAGRIDISDIDMLPVPFMACTSDEENPIAVVTQVTDTHVHHYSSRKSRHIIVERETFQKSWKGVHLIAEATEQSGEIHYNKVRRRQVLSGLVPLMLVLLLAISSISVLLSLEQTKLSFSHYIFYVIYVAGVITTSLLLWYEIDRNNPLLKKVCTGFSKGNCEAILTSSHAKLLGRLSWSEVGFFYFTGSLLALLMVQNGIYLLAWLTVCTSPYVIFSIYYQWRVAKRWCVLCLVVQTLLLLGVTTSWATHLLQPITWTVGIILKIAGCYIFPVMSWYTIKPYCLRLQQALTTKREYLRIKFNAEIFDILLKKQKTINLPGSNIGIDLGQSKAMHMLVKVCNPYCGPCASAHPKIEKLLEMNNNLRVKIIFTTSNNTEDIGRKPVKHLLAITEKQNELLTKQALDDWYLADKKDYDLFAVKYPMNGELVTQDHKIEQMSAWCKQMNVVVTPTFFLNGYQLPDVYDIEDLEYFLVE